MEVVLKKMGNSTALVMRPGPGRRAADPGPNRCLPRRARGTLARRPARIGPP